MFEGNKSCNIVNLDVQVGKSQPFHLEHGQLAAHGVMWMIMILARRVASLD
jgi:hypothetical protein